MRHSFLPSDLSPADKIQFWEKKTFPLMVAAALLPMIQVWGGRPDWITTIILVASWLVFFVDLLVHMKLKPDYLRSGVGVFDLSIVVLTFPWILLFPGAAFLDSLVVIRLARLARVMGVAIRRIPQVRLLADRLGGAGMYVGIIIVVAAGIVKRVEPESSGFDSYGDAFWWAVVTLTTVGYGDFTPVTTVGRVTGMIVMFVGLAFLGAIAGSLASFFGLGAAKPAPEGSQTEPELAIPASGSQDAGQPADSDQASQQES